MPLRYPGGETLWAVVFRLIGNEKHGFLTPFRVILRWTVYGMKKRYRLIPIALENLI